MTAAAPSGVVTFLFTDIEGCSWVSASGPLSTASACGLVMLRMPTAGDCGECGGERN
jgi:hypothetical protein